MEIKNKKLAFQGHKKKLFTLTKPSTPMVINSPSSKKNCSMLPWWHVFFPLRVNSALISPPSHRSMLPHSEPDSTFPSGSSTKPERKIKILGRMHIGTLMRTQRVGKLWGEESFKIPVAKISWAYTPPLLFAHYLRPPLSIC